MRKKKKMRKEENEKMRKIENEKIRKIRKKIEQNSKVLWIQESRRKEGFRFQVVSKIVSQKLPLLDMTYHSTRLLLSAALK